ncbi:MAG TPA: hypothetical protein VGO73_06990 [Pyrinomonadaceae bacterium]|jgi:hypothetical protein|nr:hypothetical protein [Pyrinomonadaceae bacterium]
MPTKEPSKLQTGLTKGSAEAAPAGASVELFGHVTLVEGYALPNFLGCHALVFLRDTPNKTVAVLTSAPNLQNLLETALATGNLIAFRGSISSSPPTPLGGTWSLEVYLIDSLILYNMK